MPISPDHINTADQVRAAAYKLQLVLAEFIYMSTRSYKRGALASPSLWLRDCRPNLITRAEFRKKTAQLVLSGKLAWSAQVLLKS